VEQLPALAQKWLPTCRVNLAFPAIFASGKMAGGLLFEWLTFATRSATQAIRDQVGRAEAELEFSSKNLLRSTSQNPQRAPEVYPLMDIGARPAHF
jgi:hypothetical protein